MERHAWFENNQRLTFVNVICARFHNLKLFVIIRSNGCYRSNLFLFNWMQQIRIS